MTVIETPLSSNGTQHELPPPPGHAPADREMTMIEHLEELRGRLVWSVGAILFGIIFSNVPLPGLFEWGSLTNWVINRFTVQAVADGVTLISTAPGQAFFTYLQVSLVIGAAIAMPVMIYQVLAFVSPALYAHEKRYLFFSVPGVTFSFLCGVAFCYYVLLPFAIKFLGNFQSENFKPEWTAENYLDFVSSFIFWIGLIFELPIVMYFLSKLGIVSVQRMTRFRRYALVLAFVIGAVITPTPDPVNQTIVSLPIYALFELGIILARFA